jgi:hypothetical protein
MCRCFGDVIKRKARNYQNGSCTIPIPYIVLFQLCLQNNIIDTYTITKIIFLNITNR